jgi:uncharacterized membrane protein
MATTLANGGNRRGAELSLYPDAVEKAVAAGAMLLLTVLVVALVRGWAEWGQIPTIVWLHICAIAVALVLTPLLMLRKRGTRWHRRTGWAWCVAMATTACLSLFIHGLSDGRFSWIHVLSVITLIGVYGIVTAARSHNVAKHRSTVRAVAIGALLVAGFFTLLPKRTLGHMLYG